MKAQNDWLVGQWQTWEEDSYLILDITKATNGFKVRAFNKKDGEEYIVSKTKWDGSVLSFETHVKSNDWRTKSRLKIISKTKLIQELTFWERWKKIPLTKRISIKELPVSRKKGRERNRTSQANHSTRVAKGM
jgi:hypothetical protein